MTGSARNLASLTAGLVAAVLLMLAPWAAMASWLFAWVLWLVPAPLYAVGLVYGAQAAAAAGLIGIAVVAIAPLAGGLAPAIAFAMLFSLPVAFLAFICLPQRAEPAPADASSFAPRPDWQRPDWQLPIGRALALLTLFAALIAILVFAALESQPGGYEAILRRPLEHSMEQLAQAGRSVSPEAVDAMVGQLSRMFLAATAWVMIAVHAACAAIAERFVARRGLSLAAPVAWSLLAVPGWMVLPPVAAALATLVATGPAALLAINLFLILVFPWFLQGLAVLHVLLRGATGRKAILFLFYGLALPVLIVPIGALMVGLGLVDHWSGLRRRRLDGAPPREDL